MRAVRRPTARPDNPLVRRGPFVRARRAGDRQFVLVQAESVDGPGPVTGDREKVVGHGAELELGYRQAMRLYSTNLKKFFQIIKLFKCLILTTTALQLRIRKTKPFYKRIK